MKEMIIDKKEKSILLYEPADNIIHIQHRGIVVKEKFMITFRKIIKVPILFLLISCMTACGKEEAGVLYETREEAESETKNGTGSPEDAGASEENELQKTADMTKEDASGKNEEEKEDVIPEINEAETEEDAYVFGMQYESREVLLKDFGLENNEPMYQYYDPDHNLWLELYRDEVSERFSVIFYDHAFDDDEKESVTIYGFPISIVQKQNWSDKEGAFSTKTVWGDNAANYASDPEEIIEYTSSGKPEYFRVEGWIEREIDGEMTYALTTMLEIKYTYRNDGTLYHREYWHYPFYFGSTFYSLDSFYDEKERVVFESGYITHGELMSYYIYEDEGDVPVYCLRFDEGLGIITGEMIQYK